MSLLEYIRTHLDKENCDYLYINHTNEFFSEYVDVSKSSRFLLTGFSGSTGDAIVSKNKIYLFVASRYWEQADLEVDKKITEVVKLGINFNFDMAVSKLIPSNSKILFYQDKTSFYLYEKFIKLGYDAHLTEKDLVAEYKNVLKSNLSEDFIQIPNKITALSTKQKIKKIQNKMNDNDICVISSLEDVSYIMNMRADIFEYSSVIFGKILIEKNRYEYFSDDNSFENAIKNIIKKYKTPIFLIDKSTLSIKYKKYFKNYKSASFLSNLRSIKYKSEIEYLKSCFERTDKVLEDVYSSFLKNNYTENQLFDFVNKSFLNNGAITNSFKTILASGKNSSIVHFSHPTDRKIEDSDFVLLDCGGLYEYGYATDITRTFMKSNPSKEQKLVYTTVLRAFLNAYKADLEKYKTCYDIDKIARDIISKTNLEGYTFGHGLGHSVGRCVHDGLPVLSPSVLSKIKIKENMVFTIEPGLYKPEVGGVRLENTVHVIKKGKKLVIKSFSKAPFQKKMIDFSLLSEKEKKYLNEWTLV